MIVLGVIRITARCAMGFIWLSKARDRGGGGGEVRGGDKFVVPGPYGASGAPTHCRTWVKNAFRKARPSIGYHFTLKGCFGHTLST